MSVLVYLSEDKRFIKGRGFKSYVNVNYVNGYCISLGLILLWSLVIDGNIINMKLFLYFCLYYLLEKFLCKNDFIVGFFRLYWFGIFDFRFEDIF